MLFCSQQYWLFFTLVFAVYWMMPWQRARVYLLLAASLYFYASWNHWLAAIIAVSTTFDFFVARAIDGSSDTRRRELLLSVTITANLGLLCYFKDANFFLASLEQALHAFRVGQLRACTKEMAHDFPERIVRVGVVLLLLERHLSGQAAENQNPCVRVGDGGKAFVMYRLKRIGIRPHVFYFVGG